MSFPQAVDKFYHRVSKRKKLEIFSIFPSRRKADPDLFHKSKIKNTKNFLCETKTVKQMKTPPTERKF